MEKTFSKLLILHNKLIPVICDENNFCSSLDIFLKLGSYIKDYSTELAEFYLKHISTELSKEESTVFYFSVCQDELPSIEKYLSVLHYRDKLSATPLIVENLSLLDLDACEFFLPFVEIKPNILCLKLEI